MPRTDTIPSELTDFDQWVAWYEEVEWTKGGETKHRQKVPAQPDGSFASVSDPESHSTYDGILTALNTDSDLSGLGFVFTDDDPFTGVDLDKCRDPETGEIDEWALAVINDLRSYTEVSPSGTGLHVLIKGELPDTWDNRNDGLEIYSRDRYFTVTGETVNLDGEPVDFAAPVAQRQQALEAVHEEHIGTTTSDSPTVDSAGSANLRIDTSGVSGQLTLQETADRLLPKVTLSDNPSTEMTPADKSIRNQALNASNGDVFRALWAGDWRSVPGKSYPSQSEADIALANILAFYTGGDAAQMDRLFRNSGLMRRKWDEVHYRNGCTYGEMTIRHAIAYVDEEYTGTDASQAEVLA
ncbi:hypothetical protein RYH80_18275 [Halobaculum sp. MBLA0147]|uniref:phage NrS-1 polymerase family protein n=1 Tax=Halobaculum sp. MBLA0147 TaxID=3079934 RepID=UPI0035243541